MKDIICPNCGVAFHIDESTYQTIVSQVRNHLFEEELTKRLKEIKDKVESDETSKRFEAEKDFEIKMAKKERDLNELKTQIIELQGIITGYNAIKEAEIQTLKTDNFKEVASVVTEKDKKISDLENQLSIKENEFEIRLLKAENSRQENLQKKEREIVELKALLKNEQLRAENRESQLKEYHKLQLEDKQAEIDRLKDFRQRLSTKMVGETLEQHCYIQFSQAQSMGLYPYAIFEKDNIAIEGSKGDFIFRDFIENEEYVSVMFEMKNEMDTTATKHRNEDFLEKLDKDRQKKNCEYAVLVSMLEQGNELYDLGIVDKSHRYPKMMVIRPQFFLPVLRLLTEGARKGFMEKRMLAFELEKARNESLDLSRFQEKLDKVRLALNNNYAMAHKKVVAATEGIDKAIEGLEKQIKLLKDVKSNFEKADQKLLKGTEIGEEELTIKRLTHGNPTVRKLIDNADNQ